MPDDSKFERGDTVRRKKETKDEVDTGLRAAKAKVVGISTKPGTEGWPVLEFANGSVITDRPERWIKVPKNYRTPK